MKRAVVLLAVAVLAGLGGCTRHAVEIPSWRGPSLAHQQQLLREAETFMAAYAADLRAGDRAAIAARYHPDGAVMRFNGRQSIETHAAIAERYRTSWSPPTGFEWRDLHYEAAGPDSVVVMGKFEWVDAEGTFLATYNALLAREDGVLRIRIEDEAEDPSSRPAG